MTKIDERSVVPPVDAAARARLIVALDREPVVSVALFGSQATGKAGPLSDVDIAVWLDPATSSQERWDLTLSLGVAASHALRTDEVDLVILNGAPPLLTHHVQRDGIRLLERDARARIRLESDALVRYLDTMPLRAVQAAGLRRMMENGTYGRSRPHRAASEAPR